GKDVFWVNADLAGNRAGSAGVIAGEQIGGQTQFLQLRDSSSGGVFDGVAHGDDPCELFINVHHNWGATVCFGGGKGVSESTEVLVTGATNAGAVALDGAAHTHASFGLEIVGGRMIRCVCHDRFGDGVLGARLDRGCVIK